jgi:hypothetical protein
LAVVNIQNNLHLLNMARAAALACVATFVISVVVNEVAPNTTLQGPCWAPRDHTMRFQVQRGHVTVATYVVTGWTVVTTAQVHMALWFLEESALDPSDARTWADGFVQAHAWVATRPPAGVSVEGYSWSFPRGRTYGDNPRVDIESLRGRNLTY